MLNEISISEYIVYWILLGIITGITFQFVITNKVSDNSYILVGIIGSIIGGIVSLFIYGLFTYTNISNLLISITISILSTISYHILRHNTYLERFLKRQITSKNYRYISMHSLTITKQLPKHDEVNELISNISYPASKSDILSLAEKKLSNEKSITTLELIPNHIYESKSQIKKEINKLH